MTETSNTTRNTPTYDDVAAALFAAADRIETTGLHQGGFYPGWVDTIDALAGVEVGEYLRENDTLPCCTEGAVWAAASTSRVGEVALIKLRNALGDQYPATWNDQSGRTAHQVIAVVRATAESLAVTA